MHGAHRCDCASCPPLAEALEGLHEPLPVAKLTEILRVFSRFDLAEAPARALLGVLIAVRSQLGALGLSQTRTPCDGLASACSPMGADATLSQGKMRKKKAAGGVFFFGAH